LHIREGEGRLAQALPGLYIVLGLVTVMATLGMTALLGRVAPARTYLIMPVVLALLLGGARLLVEIEFDGIYRALWVTVFVIDTFSRLVIWGIAGISFDTRQAKRLYPLFVAAGILGFAVGGLSTSVLVQLLGTENLLLAWAGLLLVTLALARIIAKETGSIRSAPMQRLRRRRSGRLRADLQAGYQYVRQSRLLFWTAVSAVLFQALYFLLAFPFSKAVEMAHPVEDEMTAFLGVFRGVTTGSALIVTLLVATRFNAHYGLMAGFLALSVFDLVGFSAMSIASPFMAIVAFRYFHEVWQTGITRTAWFALFNVVPPVRREQTRLFVNGVCLQGGVILVGITLLIGREFLHPQQLFIIGAVAAGFTLFAVFQARQAYLSALVDALRAGRPQVFSNEEDPFSSFQQDAAAMNVAMTGLSDPDPAVRRVAADILSNLNVPEAAPSLVGALTDGDVAVRIAALPAVARLNVMSAWDDVVACLSDPEAEVRARAVATLRRLAKDSNNFPMHVHPLLDDPVPAVRAVAAASLLSAGPNERAEATLRELAGAEDAESRVEALSNLGTWGGEAAFEIAAAALGDSQPVVRRAAAAALAHIDDPRCAATLVDALRDDDGSVREVVAASIEAIGTPALQLTVDALRDPDLEDGALLALDKMHVEDHADAIRGYARDRITKALHYHSLWHAAEMFLRGNDRGRLLVDSLRWVATHHAINVLRAIGTLEDANAVRVAIDSLGSNDPQQLANAVETLDSIADRDIVRPVLRLWDPSDESPLDYANVPQEEALRQSLRESSGWLRACAALAANDIDTEDIRSELARLAESDPDKIVRETAAAALDGGRPMETLQTLSIMERILFLKRVPLFANLPPAELKQVATIADEHLFVDGEIIADQNEPGDELYVIVSGKVRVTVNTNGDTDTELALRGAGEYVGEMAVISHRPRMARLVAAGDVRTLCIGQKQFEGILRERPETSLAVMRELCDRLRERESASH
jgi:HEAT repeat protein